MLDNSHKAVSYNGYSNLHANSILCGTPESLDFEMLLEPFEKQLDELSFLVKFCNFKGREMLGIGKESKITIFSSSS